MFTYERLYQQQFDVIGQLRQELIGLFSITDIRAAGRGDAVMFLGRFVQDADHIYSALRDRFKQLGYTLLLRREGEQDILVAQRGVIPLARFNPLINVLLLIATIGTTMLAGAGFAGVNLLTALRALFVSGNVLRFAEALLAGAPFALTLLFILGVHEMGHYIAARLHGVQVSLPYFIPVPFGLGTFGAFIQMRSPVENRKALFDVGVAGPLAGFVVAVPLFVAGLLLSSVTPVVGGAGRLGASLLVQWLINVVVPHAAHEAVRLHPMAIAAWFGLLVTAINLLPMGQLDGGHIAYAVFGRHARTVSMATFLGALALGFTAWSGWLTFAFFALLTGLNHAEPLNDVTPLDWPRRVIGFVTFGIFLALITLRPF
jgi:membrane-associated protease RseP (regulator of RpoE activity)